MQPLDISEYVDYGAYASSINEDEYKVSLPEGETPLNPPSPPKGDSALDAGNDPKTPTMHPAASLLECHQTNTYHGPIAHPPNSPLNSPNPPSLSPHSGTYPPGQLPLPTFQPASMQVGGYPSQTPAMPLPVPTAVTANPPPRVVIPRPSRRTKCIICRLSGSKVSIALGFSSSWLMALNNAAIIFQMARLTLSRRRGPLRGGLQGSLSEGT